MSCFPSQTSQRFTGILSSVRYAESTSAYETSSPHLKPIVTVAGILWIDPDMSWTDRGFSSGTILIPALRVLMFRTLEDCLYFLRCGGVLVNGLLLLYQIHRQSLLALV